MYRRGDDARADGVADNGRLFILRLLLHIRVFDL